MEAMVLRERMMRAWVWRIALGLAVLIVFAGGSLPVRLAGDRMRVAAAASDVMSAQARIGHLLKLPAVLPNRVLNVPILMYHHVSSQPPATELNYGLTVTDEDFRAQLAYLNAHGFYAVLLPQVFSALYESTRLPSKPIALTFDDGYLDNYTDALPLLRAFHVRGEFNIISSYVGITLGVNSYMDWAQLKALVAAGMEIGSHTVDHQDLGLMPVVKIRSELRDSRYVLQQTLSVPVQFLAYPAGQPFARGDAAQGQVVLSLMPQYGYVGALLDGPLYTSRQDARQPFQLQRIRVAGGESLAAFAASLQS
jgi:peptidoglycan/xylan/chitin deacetylase (PgdA/CDA1 family)